MKTERVYAITIYLLNYGRTSASKLARYFEVSVRTIQRDIDSLCLSGIPIIAVNGATGGYENGIILDFSVLREGDQTTLQMLQTAVLEKHTVNFIYTNNNNETRTHSVESIAVLYRWYA